MAYCILCCTFHTECILCIKHYFTVLLEWYLFILMEDFKNIFVFCQEKSLQLWLYLFSFPTLLLLLLLLIIITTIRLLFNESFSDGQLHQDVKIFITNHQHTLKIGIELVTEMSENLHILTRLFAWQNFIEFCHTSKASRLTVATSATVTTIIADTDLNVSAVIIGD